MRQKLFELFGIDLRALALIRIGLALILLIDLTLLSSDLIPFYSDEGLLPRITLLGQNPYSWFFSFHLINGSPFFQGILFLIGASFYLALLLGWRTRLFTFLSWIFLISLQSRNPYILTGGDGFLRMTLFWSLFLPLGRRYSMDEARDPHPGPPPKRILSLGTVGLLSQVLIVYGFAAYTKWQDPQWIQGEGIYAALASTHFTTPWGLLLSQHHSLLKFLNDSILCFETGGPLLLFIPILTSPVRIAVLLGFILMQIGFGICLDLGNFPWISSLVMLAFVPSPDWDKRDGRSFAWHGSIISNLFAAFFIVHVLLLNISTKNPSLVIPKKLKWLGSFLNLYQNWNLFVTGVDRQHSDYRWLVMRGIRKDGRVFNLLDGSDRVSWERPPLISALYKNMRWSKYVFDLRSNHPTLFGLGWHGCRVWNKKYTGDQQVRKVEIYLMTQRFASETAQPNKILLWRHVCFEEDLRLV